MNQLHLVSRLPHMVTGQFGAGQLGADNSERTIRSGQFGAGQLGADNSERTIRSRAIRSGQFGAGQFEADNSERIEDCVNLRDSYGEQTFILVFI